MRAVLRTLAQCHSHRILHRDIKPSNFMLLNNSDRSPLKAIGRAGYRHFGAWLRQTATACFTCVHLLELVCILLNTGAGQNWQH